MLYYWVLANDLCLEHLLQTLGNFVPRGHCRNIIEHRGRLMERTSFLNLFYEVYASKVHIVFSVIQSFIGMNVFWQIDGRVAELTSAEKEG